jgi:hypothetical protein
MGEESSRFHESPEEIEAGLEGLKRDLLKAIDPPYRDRFREIIELTDAFCREHLRPLEAEFVLCCRLLAATCCQEGTPIVEGKAKAKTWAAAIVHTVGWVNFLSDPDSQPTMSGEEMAEAFGLSVATMQRRSAEIRNGLEIVDGDPRWTLPSRMADNPLVWMVEDENGLIVDIRTLPRERQVEAYEAGIIPYIPDDAGESAGEPMGEPMGLGFPPEAFAAFINELEEVGDADDADDEDGPDDPVIGRIGPENS